jgi:hypothetical protein
LEQRASHTFDCHHPRKRMIQYAAAFVFDRCPSGVLDRPLKPGDDGYCSRYAP